MRQRAATRGDAQHSASAAIAPHLPSLASIEQAAARLKSHAVRTPLLSFPELDERMGGRVLIKPECLQRTGSFKFRGAFNTLSKMAPTVRAKGIVAVSSGNHAQGIAAAAKLLGCPATIVMPADAPATKTARVAELGAHIIAYDRACEDRVAIAADITEKQDATFVHPFDHPDVIEGQGTVGLEIAEDLHALGLTPQRYLCCCGGGGLLTGSATALKAHFPDLEIVAVEPVGFDDWKRSLKAGHRLGNEQKSGSVCDAILTEQPGDLPWQIGQKIGLSTQSVSDDEALYAVGYAEAHMRLLVEPGGAVALAALFKQERMQADEVCVVVLSGGNMDDAALAKAKTIFQAETTKQAQ